MLPRPANGTFGALVRILLLTGAAPRHCRQDAPGRYQGRRYLGASRRSPARKGNIGAVRLPAAALEIIEKRSRGSRATIMCSPPVRGNGPLAGYNKRKASFDEACGVTGWTLHDLRRTARSLMSRAGVRDEHAEHVLGHKLQGVKGVYNRYQYFKEKSAALAKLATLIERHIVHPVKNVDAAHATGAGVSDEQRSVHPRPGIARPRAVRCR